MVDANQKSLSYSRGTNVDHPRLWTKDMSRIFNLSLSHIFSGCSRNSRLLNLLLLSQVKLLSNTKKMTSGTSRGAHVYTLFHEFLSHFCTKDVFLLMVYTHFYSLRCAMYNFSSQHLKLRSMSGSFDPIVNKWVSWRKSADSLFLVHQTLSFKSQIQPVLRNILMTQSM